MANRKEQKMIGVWLDPEAYEKIEKKANNLGFRSIASYMRVAAVQMPDQLKYEV